MRPRRFATPFSLNAARGPQPGVDGSEPADLARVGVVGGAPWAPGLRRRCFCVAARFSFWSATQLLQRRPTAGLARCWMRALDAAPFLARQLTRYATIGGSSDDSRSFPVALLSRRSVEDIRRSSATSSHVLTPSCHPTRTCDQHVLSRRESARRDDGRPYTRAWTSFFRTCPCYEASWKSCAAVTRRPGARNRCSARQAAEKDAVVSGVCHGFIGNRIMAAYRRDCEFMLLEGALPARLMQQCAISVSPWECSRCRIEAGWNIAWAQRKSTASTRDPSLPIATLPTGSAKPAVSDARRRRAGTLRRRRAEGRSRGDPHH